MGGCEHTKSKANADGGDDGEVGEGNGSCGADKVRTAEVWLCTRPPPPLQRRSAGQHPKCRRQRPQL